MKCGDRACAWQMELTAHPMSIFPFVLLCSVKTLQISAFLANMGGQVIKF